MSRLQISSAPKLSHSIEKNEVFSAQVTLSFSLSKTPNPFHLSVLQFNRPFSLRTMIFLTIMAFAVAAAPEELMKVSYPHVTTVFQHHFHSSRLSPPIPWRATALLHRQRYQPLTSQPLSRLTFSFKEDLRVGLLGHQHRLFHSREFRLRLRCSFLGAGTKNKSPPPRTPQPFARQRLTYNHSHLTFLI
jgi:hypothetical protein